MVFKKSVFLFLLFTFYSCYSSQTTGSIKIPDELKIEVTFKPDDCKKTASHGDMVLIHYTGRLEDGTVFETSRVNEDSEPIEFPLGLQEVVKGWDYGMVDVCTGEKRRLTVPSSLAYGEQGKDGKVAPGATVIFDVEMIEFKPNWRHGMPNTFRMIDANNDKVISFKEMSAFIMSEGIFTDEELNQKMTKEALERDDRDGNGEVSWEEFSGPKHDEL